MWRFTSQVHVCRASQDSPSQEAGLSTEPAGSPQGSGGLSPIPGLNREAQEVGHSQSPFLLSASLSARCISRMKPPVWEEPAVALGQSPTLRGFDRRGPGAPDCPLPHRLPPVTQGHQRRP